MDTEYHFTESHHFQMFDKSILFNVETMLFYEVTPVAYDLVVLLSGPSENDPIRYLKSQYGEEEIQEAVVYLEKEGFLKRRPFNDSENRPTLKKRRGIRHLELMVTHDCNMRCRYCYGSLGDEDWENAPYLYGATTKGMDLETARRGVDYLVRESGRQKELSVTFFGGEPLLELDLIKQIVPYIRDRENESRKKINLSLSTNGLLLTEAVVEYLIQNHIGCQVSIDGPKHIHDRTRCLPDGEGAYDTIIAGVKRLIAARRGRTPARATVAHGTVDLPAVAEHLLSLGFGSAHIEPAIGTSGSLMVSREDIEEMKKQNELLASSLVRNVKQNRFFNYTNLVRFIRQTRVVRERQAHHCGAGRTYFALSQEGDFYPCHRFVGMEEYRMGNVERGMDLILQEKILDLTVDNRPVCRDCWARYLCGGGCWKHAVDMNGCLEEPDNELSCELIRHQIECAMAINSELNVEDKDILSDVYEKEAEPYLVPERKDGNYVDEKER
jgi:uncharacterized protein